MRDNDRQMTSDVKDNNKVLRINKMQSDRQYENRQALL